MKLLNILLITGCIVSTSAGATGCANGGGEIITGRDNVTSYCLSTATMNWWSAFAWCDAAGGHLINTNTECNKVTTTNTVDCPNLEAVTNKSISVWSTNQRSSTRVYAIYLDSGKFEAAGFARSSKTNSDNHALCVI